MAWRLGASNRGSERGLRREPPRSPRQELLGEGVSLLLCHKEQQGVTSGEAEGDTLQSPDSSRARRLLYSAPRERPEQHLRGEQEAVCSLPADSLHIPARSNSEGKV